MGYTLLGIASILIGVARLSQARRLSRVAGVLFMLTATLVFVWDIGFIFEIGGIEGIGALGSGVAFLGAVITAAVLLARRGYGPDTRHDAIPLR